MSLIFRSKIRYFVIKYHMKHLRTLASALFLTLPALAVDLNWEQFLGRNDMLWDKLPDHWNSGPFVGNGKLGTIFWQKESGEFHFEVSRSDLYDNRRLADGYSVLFARCRMPNGHFALSFGDGKPTGKMRLDLWNAEAKGKITLGANSWDLRCFTHANGDVIVLEVAGPGPAPQLTWNPDESKPTRRRSGMPGNLRGYPAQTRSEVSGITVSVQEMPDAPEYNTQGQGASQYATAWTTVSSPNRTVYYISTRITTGSREAADEAVDFVRKAKTSGIEVMEKSHRAWWHTYYPKSFLTVPNSTYESFYWIQMYKMASASRQGGPVLDLMGPWFSPTNWPAIWWNLNIQLTYWPYYMSNHLEEAEPLIESIWNGRENLAKNAAPHSADSYAVGRATGLDFLEPVGGEVGNLPWTMHNLWLHYRSTMDDDLLREKIFPLMKGSFRYLQHILVEQPDGTLKLPSTASPEYIDSVASCSYTIACLRWLAATLITADGRLKANDPIVADCRKVLVNLEPYPVDEQTGIMVGQGVTFTNSHRHWSHLFMIYPFYEYTWEQTERVPLMEKSLNNWTNRPQAFAGYSWLGAASMHAAAGRGDVALGFLDSFLKKSPLPNTLYREMDPVMETPLAYGRTLQEMLLTSHGDLIRIFPGIPTSWSEVAFADMRTEGAFLVSAQREEGKTQWVKVESLAGEPCRIRTGLEGEINTSPALPLKDLGNGVVEIALPKGQSVVLHTGNAAPDTAAKPAALNGPAKPWGGQMSPP